MNQATQESTEQNKSTLFARAREVLATKTARVAMVGLSVLAVGGALKGDVAGLGTPTAFAEGTNAPITTVNPDGASLMDQAEVRVAREEAFGGNIFANAFEGTPVVLFTQAQAEFTPLISVGNGQAVTPEMNTVTVASIPDPAS